MIRPWGEDGIDDVKEMPTDHLTATTRTLNKITKIIDVDVRVGKWFCERLQRRDWDRGQGGGETRRKRRGRHRKRRGSGLFGRWRSVRKGLQTMGRGMLAMPPTIGEICDGLGDSAERWGGFDPPHWKRKWDGDKGRFTGK
jgi:hypothetical protein